VRTLALAALWGLVGGALATLAALALADPVLPVRSPRCW
jgi:hypothetical protein